MHRAAVAKRKNVQRYMTVTAINNRVSSNIQTEVIIYDHMDRNMSTVVCDAGHGRGRTRKKQ